VGTSKWYKRLMFYDVDYVANDITYVMLMLLMVLLLLSVLCSWLVE
jgi:fumarate reductase subunit C